MSSETLENGGPIPSPCNMYVDLFSCASLRIGEDDWSSLVNSGILCRSSSQNPLSARCQI